MLPEVPDSGVLIVIAQRLLSPALGIVLLVGNCVGRIVDDGQRYHGPGRRTGSQFVRAVDEGESRCQASFVTCSA